MTSKLQQLIYNYNNIIVIKSKTIKDIVLEIEAVRNASSIEGFIFRPAFANNVEFSLYTQKDYYAIYAQWSLSFGWSNIFKDITGDNPQNILDEYLTDKEDFKIEPLVTEEKSPIVKEINYLNELAISLINSKSVLTSHQKSILKNMPINVLLDTYSKSSINIREIRTLVISLIIKKKKDFNPFNSVSDIIPILIENYSINDSFLLPEGKMFNKAILKKVKIKVPTSVKRNVIKTISKEFNKKTAIENFKKYQDFWKKVLKQILISNSFEKTIKQYPDFKKVHEIIYSNINTDKTAIEKFRKNGLLKEAFELEMNNVGNLLRNIIFYLRNPKESVYPTKENSNSVNKITVKTDINDLLYSEEFANVLKKANPKLLIQIKSLLENKKYSDIQFSKLCNNKIISYTKEIPSINKEWTEFLIELIDNTYKEIKKENNKKLGKVYISNYFKDIKLNFSGRIDVNTNTSGKFLPIGSKIKIDKLLDEDTILRYGVSWKSPEKDPFLSICIDPSLHIMNGIFKNRIINWQGNHHTLKNKNKILISSSGDITQCSFDKWSTELIDIDVDAMRKAKSTKMFTAVINYDAGNKGSLGEVDTHIFVNIINRKDRVISGRTIKIPLDKMDYSYKIDENVQCQIGLSFDLDEGTIEVLKLPIYNIYNNSNANDLHQRFINTIHDKPELPFLYDVLSDSIKKEQIVQNPKDADTIISDTMDIVSIQNIIF